jgi:phosphoenolpyruvate-protein kinase (PTS system EI component)
MTSAGHYRGLAVSEGLAIGQLYLGDPPGGAQQGAARPGTPQEVREAFSAVAQERSALAAELRERGRAAEAEIVGIGALIAADPALVNPAVAATAQGTDAGAAVRYSAEAQAAALAALANADLAARADDVRQVASAVLAHLAGDVAPPPPATGFILVRREVDPADLIRYAEGGLVGAVSVAGSASSHAAIIARGLGVPMLAGTDPDVLAAPAGHPAILDAVSGRLTVDPAPEELAAVAGQAAPSVAAGSVQAAEATQTATATQTAGAPRPAAANGGPGRGLRDGGSAVPAPADPPHTADGQPVTLLCNVASAAETRLGLARGAAGVGLLRTEIPFTRATGWPTGAEHAAALEPVLGLLSGKPAVVRLLDFSGDKIPPFLAGGRAGLAALLTEPRALGGQLRAILRSGRDTQLGVMVPMVTSPEEMARVKASLADAAAEVGSVMPGIGMMVEVAATAAAAEAFTPGADFFSIGTNDLTSEVLGIDRADPRMRPALAADPRVLALIAHVVAAAGAAGVTVSVCGDAAADPAVLPLLIGLGVRTFSVGAARLPQVAAWVSAADTARCAALAQEAMQAATARQAP